MKHKKIIVFLLAGMLSAGCAQQSTAVQTEETPLPEETAVVEETAVPQETALPQETAAEEETYPQIEAGIDEISKYGNIVLTIDPEAMKEHGYEPADIVTVRIGDKEMDMPVGTAYTDVDSGEPVCCYKFSSSRNREEVVLSVNTGNMVEAMGVAKITKISEDPGYKYEWAEGMDDSTTVYLNMKEKQGFAEEYAMHQLGAVRTNKREDYAHLSDAEYANFRMVRTTGMGAGTLYRSSSPVNPAYKRNEQADAAMLDAQIKTVMNMADSEGQMKAYSEFASTYYAGCDIIPLNMGMNFSSEEFRQKLAEGFRYIASHEGPYLIHCNEGKDRTGFALGLLECLMGAGKEEIIEDYMLTFYNYYGIEPGTDLYTRTADSNLLKSLAEAFHTESLDGIDLAKSAEAYLEEIGMTADEIKTLKEKLSTDFIEI